MRSQHASDEACRVGGDVDGARQNNIKVGPSLSHPRHRSIASRSHYPIGEPSECRLTTKGESAGETY